VRDIAVEIDQQLGRLMERLPEGATLFLVSLHGMMPEYGATDLLPRFLDRWAGVERAPGERAAYGTDSLASRLLSRVRVASPPALRSRLKVFAPYWLRQNFRAHYYMSECGQQNWAGMRAFCLPSDDHGYIRVNLKGREPQGLVEPGSDYARLLDELTEELHAWRDTEHGGPVVDQVIRPQERWPGPFSVGMPDLVVTWRCERPLTAVRTRRHGEIRLERRMHMRSGVHRSRGFMLARGPHIHAGRVLEGGHALDLPPTILATLPASIPQHLDGRVLSGLFRA
jgi:predicted AlkP superfamily phosphohydrolase/phosphomutase